MFELTLDNSTKLWLGEYYKKDHIILEYGTGGSTFLALESNPNTKVYACETDKKWLESVNSHAKKLQVDDRLFCIHTDVGRTGKWGYPIGGTQTSTKMMQKFLRTSVTPWKILKSKGVDPNVVFIDGRFRKACFLTALINCKKPIKVIWDDYGDRPHYKVFENLIKPTEMIGRTAIFDICPNKYDPSTLLNDYIQVYGDST